jgi:hypothetical protein
MLQRPPSRRFQNSSSYVYDRPYGFELEDIQAVSGQHVGAPTEDEGGDMLQGLACIFRDLGWVSCGCGL